MSMMKFALCALLLATLAPAVRSAWIDGCPGTFSAPRLPTDAATRLQSFLPATLYMRKTRSQEDAFRCVKLAAKTRRSEPAEDRWLFWPDPVPVDYTKYTSNFTIQYKNTTDADFNRIANYTISSTAPLALTITGPPKDLFSVGKDYDQVKLFLSDITDNYAVFQRCMDDTIIGHYYYGYMFLKQTISDTSMYNTTCVANQLATVTSLTGWKPANWCA